MTCTAKTAKGTRCTRPALRGRDVCHAHAGDGKVGRPSALTPEVHDRLVQATKAGAPDWVAAQSAGISLTTYYELRKRGRTEESGPYRELFEAVERAKADAYLHAMVTWRRAMRENWRASVAYVDRVDRGRFGGSGSAGDEQVSSSANRPDLSQLSAEELEILERLHERPKQSEE